jgi:RecA-family ATPase
MVADAPVRDPEISRALDVASAALRTASEGVRKLQIISDAAMALEPFGDEASEAVDHLSDLATEIHDVRPDDVQIALSNGFRRAIEARAKTGKPQQEEGPPQPLETFSAAEFQGREPEPRRWLVKDRIPMMAVTLLAGDGATGKTTIAMQLCVCVAGSISGWLNGFIDEYGPALFYSAEEDKIEVHRRLHAIVKHYGIDYPPGLHCHCATEINPQLAAAKGRFGQLEPTRAYEALRLRLQALRPKLIVLEASADLFGGDEINRTQVRLFVSHLRKLARDFDCAVMLLSHPSVRGINDDTGTSGNTAWNNSARARLYFKTIEDRPGLRKLEVKKSNYGPAGEVITVEWRDGVYVPEARPGSFERLAGEQKADEVFLTILRRFTTQGRNASANHGTTYAPALFAGEPEAKELPQPKKALADAMTRLFAAKRIYVAEEGPPSRKRTRLAETKVATNDDDDH